MADILEKLRQRRIEFKNRLKATIDPIIDSIKEHGPISNILEIGRDLKEQTVKAIKKRK
jgi:hypothetical protein